MISSKLEQICAYPSLHLVFSPLHQLPAASTPSNTTPTPVKSYIATSCDTGYSSVVPTIYARVGTSPISMSLVLYVAHSGGYLRADGNSFTSLEELRRWIEQNLRLPASCQILMTSRGTNVRGNAISHEKEIFIYDRKQLELSSHPILESTPKLPSISPFPNDIESETDMNSWRLLFKKRKQWAEQLLVQSEVVARHIRETETATRIIQRSVTVAYTNLETHTSGLAGSLSKMREWATTVMNDRETLLVNWEPAVKKLLRIPVHDDFKKYAPEGRAPPNKKVSVLADFFEVKEVQTTAATSRILADRFEKDVNELNTRIHNICTRSDQLKLDIQQIGTKSDGNIEGELAALQEDIDILVNKVRTDYEYTRSLQGAKSASAASKRAYASTTDYLPGLTAVFTDMCKLYLQALESKNSVSATSLDHLQQIAVIQSTSAPINPQINELDQAYQDEENHFMLLQLVVRLPLLYGSLLVECIRRREWSDKFAGSSQRLAEELALMKEDEEKRRRKWHRSTGQLLPFDLGDTSQVVRAELNTRGDPSGGLPNVTRQDVEMYIAALKKAEGMDDVVKELTQGLQDLDKPSKRINKRVKGFKMGSVHEANMMNSSFIGANEDEVKALRADKATLSERIKGYESRIRKLEDLVHRGRSTNMFQPNSPTPQHATLAVQGLPPSNVQIPQPPEQLNPNPPIPHRRSSSEATAIVIEPLREKISSLEAELAVERATTEQLQREASEKTESEKQMTARITQADDTKRDLVANLEATVQEHVTEKNALRQEIHEYKLKLEEAYESLDRLEEEQAKSRENLCSEVDKLRELHEQDTETTKRLADELAVAKKEKNEAGSTIRLELEKQTRRAEEEAQRAEEAEAALSASEKATARLVENIALVEKQLKQAKEELAQDKQRHTISQALLATTMRQAHEHLTSDIPPEDLGPLMDQIEALISRSVAKTKDLSSKLEESKAALSALEEEHKILQARFDTRTLRAKDLTQRHYTHMIRCMQLLESLGYRVVKGEDSMQIVKVSRSGSTNDSTILTRSTTANPTPEPNASQPVKSSPLSITQSSTVEDINLLYWMESPDSDTESEKYSQFLKTIGAFDLDAFSETIINRLKKSEQDRSHMTKQARAYREKLYRAREDASEKIAYKSFKTGDLALFLPTRNNATRPWAAFNVGAPHYFLNEQDSHKLSSRDWLLARITKAEERIVDLSRSTLNLPQGVERSSIGGNSSDGGFSIDEENPFELSDGLRWHLLDAVEEKPGAPSTPGLSSSTVAAANVDAKGSLKSRKPISGAKKKLSEITTEASRRSTGTGSNRNSVALSSEAVAAVRAAVENGGAGAEVALIESAPGTPRTPRTPVEKVVQSVTRSRAASFRSAITGNTQPS
ncbi:autophagy-related protein 11-domain-containing protein [Geopyxis carbonaria]|nr:autophagy-related protein 11-domain-containing protein [Geopyxis carbonaria]